MEIINEILTGVVVFLAVILAGAVLLYVLAGVFDGMAVAFAGMAHILAGARRLFGAVRRAVLYICHRKWRPEWKARERKAWEEGLNARKRREHQEMLARVDALKNSQGA